MRSVMLRVKGLGSGVRSWRVTQGSVQGGFRRVHTNMHLPAHSPSTYKEILKESTLANTCTHELTTYPSRTHTHNPHITSQPSTSPFKIPPPPSPWVLTHQPGVQWGAAWRWAVAVRWEARYSGRSGSGCCRSTVSSRRPRLQRWHPLLAWLRGKSGCYTKFTSFPKPPDNPECGCQVRSAWIHNMLDCDEVLSLFLKID